MILSEHKLQAVAKAAASGLSPQEIETYSGVGTPTVKQLLKGGHNERFDLIYAGWQTQSLAAVVDHRFRLQELLDKAYAALDDGLLTNNIQHRLDTAKYIIETLFGSVGRNKADVNVNLGFQANLHTEELNVAIGDIGSQLGDLLTKVKEQRAAGPDPHEKVGADALPASQKIDEGEIIDLDPKPNGKDEVPQGTPVESAP